MKAYVKITESVCDGLAMALDELCAQIMGLESRHPELDDDLEDVLDALQKVMDNPLVKECY